MSDKITIRRLGPEAAAVLENVADGVFDNPVDPAQARAFLAAPGNVMHVALAGDLVVGMATGCVLLHPDKPPQFFVNEVGTGDAWLRRGIARRLVEATLAAARAEGWRPIWLATESDNTPALALYRAMGGRETGDLVMFDWDDDETGE